MRKLVFPRVKAPPVVRTIDKVVADDIGFGDSGGVAENVPISAPVIDHVVDVLVDAFHFGIASVVINQGTDDADAAILCISPPVECVSRMPCAMMQS